MAPTYSTETIAQELTALEVPGAAFLARALTALITGRKATLHQIANLLPQSPNTEAARQQIRRFLDQPALTQEHWAKTLAKLVPTRPPWVLALDRTEWKLGEKPINLLVLALVCKGCAVPLLWRALEKQGASDTGERIALLEQFVRLFGTKCLRFVTADREFIGREWVAWLLWQKLPFRIRIKAGEWLRAKDGREKRAGDRFASRACPCRKRAMLLWGLWVFVGGKRLHRGRSEYLIVISNVAGDLLEDYRLRWKIETLFQAFKGRGFEMESCRLTEPVRWGAFLGFLSLSLCWCLRVGAFLEHLSPSPMKKHGRLAISVFRRGLDHLQELLACLSGRACEAAFLQAVRQLRPMGLK